MCRKLIDGRVNVVGTEFKVLNALALVISEVLFESLELSVECGAINGSYGLKSQGQSGP